jgi:hypothetical protein
MGLLALFPVKTNDPDVCPCWSRLLKKSKKIYE